MKKQSLFIFLNISMIVFFIYPATAQKIDFTSPEKNFKRVYSKVIEQNEQGFLIVRSLIPFNGKATQLRFRDSRIELSFMDNNLNTKWLFPVQLPTSDAEIQHIMLVSDSLYIFYSSISKLTNANELYAVQVDLMKGGLVNSPMKLDEIFYDKKRNKGFFYIGKGKKNNASFFSMYKQFDADNNKLMLGLKVYDARFNKTWEQKYATNYTENLLLNDYEIGQDGTIYFLTSIEVDQYIGLESGFRFFIASPSSTELKTIPLFLESFRISDLKFALDTLNSHVVFAGFYSEQNSNAASGLFYATMNLTTNELQFSKNSFKAKLLNEREVNRVVNRGTELINYYIDHIILRTDGGVILVMESNYITESTNYNSYYQLYTTSYTYHYDNVLVFSLNTDGTIDWEGVLRKNQVSEDDGAFYSSYILSVDADQIHFIYNKFIKRATDIMMYTINNKGESEEKTLVRETEGTLIMPNGGKQIAADQLIIPCIQKNKTNFIRITF